MATDPNNSLKPSLLPSSPKPKLDERAILMSISACQPLSGRQTVALPSLATLRHSIADDHYQQVPPRISSRDIVVLVAVVLLSIVTYMGRLGFYNDDWFFLGEMVTSPDQSLSGLYASLARFEHLAARPLQIALQLLLYRAFGLDATGYHLAYGGLFVAMAVMLYLALRELRLPQLSAFAVAIVFALLPTYSTNRFWFAAFGYTITVLAYSVSLYADLRAFREPNRPHWGWKTIGLLALVVCGMGYEIMFPFLVANLLLVTFRVRQLQSAPLHSLIRLRPLLVAIAMNVAALSAIVLFKSGTSGIGMIGRRWIAYHSTLLVIHVGIEIGSFGLGLLQAAFWALNHLTISQLLAVALTVTLTFARSSRIIQQSYLPDGRVWGRHVLAGAAIYAIGYAMFILTGRFTYTVTGIGNRTSMASAVGLAMMLIGICGVFVSLIHRKRVRELAMAVVLAGVAGSSIAVTLALSNYWVEAARIQDDVLAAVQTKLPEIVPGTTVILDGVCPYHGPVSVFDSDWDFAGSLRTVYRDKTLNANVVTPRMHLKHGELVTTVYGTLCHIGLGQHCCCFVTGLRGPAAYEC